MQSSTNPTGSTKKKFVIPQPTEVADALVNEFAVSGDNMAMFNEWRKKQQNEGSGPKTSSSAKKSLAASTSSSALTFDDSRSRSGVDGQPSVPVVYFASEESNHPFLRQGVEEDSKLAAGADDEDEEEPDQEALALSGAVAKPASAKLSGQDLSSSSGQRMMSSSSTPQTDWTKKKFRYMVDSAPKPGQKKRASSQVMEHADEFDIGRFPQRILIAKHIRRPKWGNKPLPPGLSQFTYEFYIYKSLKHLLQDMKNTKNIADRTLFTVAEENGVVFLYFDLEIPVAHVDPKIHGTSPLGLFGYCLALIKSILSLVVGVNTSCWADSYLIFDSTNAEKWSAHVHVPLPFRMIGSLREIMAKAKEILFKLFEVATLIAVRPMFYLGKTKKGTFEWKTVVDLGVYTKKRNFRLPLNTKCEKNAYLKCANEQVPAWNRHPQMPCSVDVKNTDELITSGMILARNSRAFWNPVTVKFQPLLKDRYGADPTRSDFRCLPTTGIARSTSETLHALYNAGDAWPAEVAINLEGRASTAYVADKVHSLFEALYEENWKDMTRPFINSDLPEHMELKALVTKFYWLCESSPRRMAMAMLLLQQLYRPGAGLDQKASGGRYTLNICQIIADTLDEQLFKKSAPVAALNTLLAFHHTSNKFFFRACSDKQSELREAFFKELVKDFLDNYINKIVVQNAYTREHLRDVFVLNNIARYLLICSGYYIHAMQVPASCPTPSINVLPETPLGYQRADLDRMYDYVFRTSCAAEGKSWAPLVGMLNQRRRKRDNTIEMFVVHRQHYSEDLLQTVKRIRSTHLNKSVPADEDEDSESDDRQRAMFSIVNGHNKPEFPK